MAEVTKEELERLACQPQREQTLDELIEGVRDALNGAYAKLSELEARLRRRAAVDCDHPAHVQHSDGRRECLRCGVVDYSEQYESRVRQWYAYHRAPLQESGCSPSAVLDAIDARVRIAGETK